MSSHPQPYPAKLAELEELLGLVGDRNARIDFLISTADRFREVPPAVAERPFSDRHKVPACESQAYAWAVPRDDGTLRFYFAVENPQGISAKALAVILDDTLSGAPLDSIVAVPSDVVHTIFGNELSMGKSMGLTGMLAMVQRAARQAISTRS